MAIAGRVLEPPRLLDVSSLSFLERCISNSCCAKCFILCAALRGRKQKTESEREGKGEDARMMSADRNNHAIRSAG